MCRVPHRLTFPSLTQILVLVLALLIASPGQAQDLRAETSNERANLSKFFFDVRVAAFSPAKVAGLPTDSQPEILTWPIVYRLALIQARAANHPRFERLDDPRLEALGGALSLDDFTRFRTDMVANQDFRDPAPAYLNLQSRLLEIEAAQRNLAQHERWAGLLMELINGQSSGFGLLDLDQNRATTVEARQVYLRAVASYRDELDGFKVTLGLSPRAAVVVDPAPLATFRADFEAINRWLISPRRSLSELDDLVRRLPELGDLMLGDRAVLAEIEANWDRLGAVLVEAARVALANRPDGSEPADAVELRVRHRVRLLSENRFAYGSELRSLVMNIRLLDDTFEQIIAPTPSPTSPNYNKLALNLGDRTRQVVATQNRIVALWTSFHAERLTLERDLGRLPAEDWSAFLGQFSAQAPDPKPAPPVELDPPSPPPIAPAAPTLQPPPLIVPAPPTFPPPPPAPPCD